MFFPDIVLKINTPPPTCMYDTSPITRATLLLLLYYYITITRAAVEEMPPRVMKTALPAHPKATSWLRATVLYLPSREQKPHNNLSRISARIKKFARCYIVLVGHNLSQTKKSSIKQMNFGFCRTRADTAGFRPSFFFFNRHFYCPAQLQY